MTENLIASSVHRVIFGLGVTGLSCARYLYQRGESFSVVDTRDVPPGLLELRREMPDVPVFTATIPVRLLESAVEIIVSPGVALSEPVLTAATEAGVPLVGDIDLFVREASAPVIGITGSNGKSTVTEWVGQMARVAGLNVGVGGNLGVAALDLLDPARQLYVLELSSFQLERAAQLKLKVACVLNMSADHFDRHGNMQHYHKAKHQVFAGCAAAVVNRSDPLTVPLVPEATKVLSWSMSEPELGGFGLSMRDGVETICFGFEALLPSAQVSLPGRHNLANALAALAIGYAAGIDIESMLDALQHFDGLAHRCEIVADIGSTVYINDSKGTNVGATRAALEGLGSARNVVLIAGGQAKGANFNDLRSAVSKHCKLVLVVGEAALQLEQCLADVVDVIHADSLEQAVMLAASKASSGDCVLLSPACASFDMFDGYQQRGDAFIDAVTSLPEVSQ